MKVGVRKAAGRRRLGWITVLPLSAAIATASCLFYQPIEPSLLWHPFEATAYCDDGFTASGVYVRQGIVAGDPRVLPLGSVIDVRVDDDVFVRREVMDTGGRIKGYIIDIWMDSCQEAIQFGRRTVKVRVRSLGPRV